MHHLQWLPATMAAEPSSVILVFPGRTEGGPLSGGNVMSVGFEQNTMDVDII
jgi:hypothetical protein